MLKAPKKTEGKSVIPPAVMKKVDKIGKKIDKLEKGGPANDGKIETEIKKIAKLAVAVAKAEEKATDAPKAKAPKLPPKPKAASTIERLERKQTANQAANRLRQAAIKASQDPTEVAPPEVPHVRQLDAPTLRIPTPVIRKVVVKEEKDVPAKKGRVSFDDLVSSAQVAPTAPASNLFDVTPYLKKK